ncbi:MAG: hypothetical protein FWH32_04850 [Clostridiales bacterium]|nr:hypothetical protein [Clostridiales bacterium]
MDVYLASAAHEAAFTKERDTMTALRQEVIDYIKDIPEPELEALRPVLRLLASPDRLVIETDLTDEEKAIIDAGRIEWETNPQSFRRVV